MTIKLTGELCECGHDRAWHHAQRNDKHNTTLPCVADVTGFQMCGCTNFKQYKGEGTPMPKTKKATRSSAKREPSKPKLAGLFEGATSIFANVGGKEVEASVHKDGTVVFKGKDYKSPSAAGKAACGNEVNGWVFWHVRDGRTLGQVTSRDIKAVKEAEKRAKRASEPKAAKKAAKPRAVRADKPKRVRKPKAAPVERQEPREAIDVDEPGLQDDEPVVATEGAGPGF